MASLQHRAPAPPLCDPANSTALRWPPHPERRDSRRRLSTRILILYRSASDHIDALTQAMADGAEAIAEIEVTLKRMPEEQVLRADGKPKQAVLTLPGELQEYDGIIFGIPTLSGNLCTQISDLLDQSGELWMENSLFSKVGSIFTSTQDEDQETNITSFQNTMLHHGMIFVDATYPCQELLSKEEGASDRSKGATILTDRNDSLAPSADELTIARFQGRYVAQITQWLVRGNA